MSDDAIAGELARIEAVCGTLRQMIDTTRQPGVAVALRHALNYAHLAGSYVGDELLSPEVDLAVEPSEARP